MNCAGNGFNLLGKSPKIGRVCLQTYLCTPENESKTNHIFNWENHLVGIAFESDYSNYEVLGPDREIDI